MAETPNETKEAPKKEERKERKDEKAEPAKKEQKMRQETSIVRIAGKDISGSKDISGALMGIKGIGFNMANALARAIELNHGINRNTEIGVLTEEQISTIEDVIKDPLGQAKVPIYMLNRRKDLDTGVDMHLVGTDLIVRVKQDIDNELKNQTWRGFRHRYGQKVRGQRTRSTGRTGATVGVTKKAVKELAKASAAGAQTASQAPGAAAPASAAKSAGAADKPAAATKPAAESK